MEEVHVEEKQQSIAKVFDYYETGKFLISSLVAMTTNVKQHIKQLIE